MKRLAAGCCVIDPDEGKWQKDANRRYRVPISGGMGAKLLAQTVSRYTPGVTPGRMNPSSEEVHYVVSGRGACFIDGFVYGLEQGVGIFVPRGAEFVVENRYPEELTLVSVTCPEEKNPKNGLRARMVPNAPGRPPARTVQERDCKEIPTGDRTFRVLVDKELGCEQVTQFVGFIPPSKAPPHFHTYEEAIYILEGEGIVWAGDEQAPFRPGTSIYLPPGVHHCLENPSSGPIRLLGVFYPSGSPAARSEAEEQPAS